jgi:hypothetical protein
MPTIEIASINAIELGIVQADFGVAIIEDRELISHRSLYYDILREQRGAIIHIGNPELKNDKDNGFFVGQIIDWNYKRGDIIIPIAAPEEGTAVRGANQQFQFQFLNQFRGDINSLLNIALDKSPIRRICFLSDYQFGSETATIEILYTISISGRSMTMMG